MNTPLALELAPIEKALSQATGDFAMGSTQCRPNLILSMGCARPANCRRCLPYLADMKTKALWLRCLEV
jgi:hypothetical protein